TLSVSLSVMEVKRPELTEFRGVCMSHYFTDNFDNVEKFQARPDDILIATYPKAGTTWVSELVDQVYFGVSDPGRFSLPVYERVPFLEICVPSLMTGTEAVEKMSSCPRLIKTHLPLQLVPPSFWEQNCRVMCVFSVYRVCSVCSFSLQVMCGCSVCTGCVECLLSLYRRCVCDVCVQCVQAVLTVFSLSTGDVCVQCVQGVLSVFSFSTVVFGSWYDHVTGWWERRQTHPRLLYLFYEDLKEDLPRELDRLCAFLGVPLSERDRQSVLGAVGFETMRSQSQKFFSISGLMDQSISPFMRKGMVGDWKNHFTVAQSEAFDEDYRRKMKDSTLSFRMELEREEELSSEGSSLLMGTL
ncbi:ST1S1 sulfotransferase, partial [Atractosteus spatula]|nr:ST1S1 sulfotransferase [Atractosteus spatula]